MTSNITTSIPQILANASLYGGSNNEEISALNGTIAALQRELAQARESRVHGDAELAHLKDLNRELHKSETQALSLPETQPADTFMRSLTALIDKRVMEEVSVQVTAHVTAALQKAGEDGSLMAAFSAEHEAKIEEIVERQLSEHRSDYDHEYIHSFDSRLEDVETQLEHQPDEDRIIRIAQEAVRDVIDEVIDERVESAISSELDNYDISDKIEEYLGDNNYITAENLREARIHLA